MEYLANVMSVYTAHRPSAEIRARNSGDRRDKLGVRSDTSQLRIISEACMDAQDTGAIVRQQRRADSQNFFRPLRVRDSC